MLPLPFDVLQNRRELEGPDSLHSELLLQCQYFKNFEMNRTNQATLEIRIFAVCYSLNVRLDNVNLNENGQLRIRMVQE